MDGFEATRRLRAESRTPELPIIATSASATNETQSRSRQAGANHFLPKPLDHASLLHAIGTLLKLHWVHEESAILDVVAEPDDHDLVPPPPEEILVLRRLARVGNMRAIVERADHVIAMDPRYAAFGDRLRKLAEGYQSKAIALLVERYSEQREES
jgi:CheY-like chemotaxis protein